MSWARQMADRKKVNKTLVRCKNAKHEDKRKKVLERDARREERLYAKSF